MKRKSFFLSIFVPEKRLLTWVLSYIVLFLLSHPILGQTSGTLTVMEDTTLTQDHQGKVIIGADNVTFDCDGFTVSGPVPPSGNGIELTSRSGVTVEDCNVTGFSNGFLLSGSNNNTFTQNTSHNNLSGFTLLDSSYNTFDDNTAINNQGVGRPNHGFGIRRSNNNTFTDKIRSRSKLN